MFQRKCKEEKKRGEACNKDVYPNASLLVSSCIVE